jgi:colicin import membrane protein
MIRLMSVRHRLLLHGFVPLLAAWLLSACASAPLDPADHGAQLASRYPEGSISSRSDIAGALDAARAARVAADAQWQDAQDRCLTRFFVNACIDRARQSHLQAQRQARRVTVEAHALERKLDAQARLQAQTEQSRGMPTAEQRAAQEARARADWEARQRRAVEASAERAAREQEAAARSVEQQQRLAAEQARAAERQRQSQLAAERARDAADRQQRAAAYAQDKARERADNERRRAERQVERDRKLVEQGRAPPVSATAPAGKADAPPPKEDLPPDIPPPAALDDKVDPAKK